MENRFGVKDFVLVVLLVLVIASIWIAMKQFDRQWTDVKRLNTQVSQLTTEQAHTRNEISDLRSLIERGVTLSGGEGLRAEGTGDKWAGYDPHWRLREAREMPGYATGDWFIDAFATTATSTITAYIEKDLYGRRVHQQVLETLLDMDPDTLETTPFIAESWRVEDNTEAWKAYKTEAEARYGEEADADPSVYAESLKKLVEDSSVPAEEGGEVYERLVGEAREGWINGRIREDPERPYALKVVFKLRRGVRFSDGHPVTAEDMVFSYNLLFNPELDAAQTRAFYDIIENCEATGEYEVTYTVREPHYYAVEYCGAQYAIPKHFYEKYTIEEINRMPALLMGSGPYRLRDPVNGWNPGESVILVRNERYWGPAPSFDQLVFRFVGDDSARMTMYTNGETDMFVATPEQFDILKEDREIVERSHVLNYPLVPNSYLWIGWQQERDGRATKFADKRVRQAMTYLIDRQSMARDVWNGYAQPITGPFPGREEQSDTSLEPRRYDPVKARALLAEAGWSDRDDDGVIENAAGEPFRFSLTYPAQSADYDRMVLYIKDSMSREGIVMEPEPLEFSVLIDRLEQQTFDAITLRWGGGAPEADIRQMFHSSQAFKGGDNVVNYKNTELDGLIDRARALLDREPRMGLWRQCHRILYEDQPYTFVATRNALRFVDKRIHNIQFTTTGLNDTDRARTEWFVPEPMQKWE